MEAAGKVPARGVGGGIVAIAEIGRVIERGKQAYAGNIEAGGSLIDGAANIILRITERSEKVLPSRADAEELCRLQSNHHVLPVGFAEQGRFHYCAMELVSGFDIGGLHDDPFAPEIQARGTVRLVRANPAGESNLQPVGGLPVKPFDGGDLAGKNHLRREGEPRLEATIQKENEGRVFCPGAFEQRAVEGRGGGAGKGKDAGVAQRGHHPGALGNHIVAGVEDIGRQHEVNQVISRDPGRPAHYFGEVGSADKPAGHRSGAQRGFIAGAANRQRSALRLVETGGASIHLKHLADELWGKRLPAAKPLHRRARHTPPIAQNQAKSIAARGDRHLQGEMLKAELQHIRRLLLVPTQLQVAAA